MFFTEIFKLLNLINHIQKLFNKHESFTHDLSAANDYFPSIYYFGNILTIQYRYLYLYKNKCNIKSYSNLLFITQIK